MRWLTPFPLAYIQNTTEFACPNIIQQIMGESFGAREQERHAFPRIDFEKSDLAELEKERDEASMNRRDAIR
jgi:hypothetical protein